MYFGTDTLKKAAQDDTAVLAQNAVRSIRPRRRAHPATGNPESKFKT